MNPRFVLRDLPGIAELERLFDAREAHPNPNWAPENEAILARAESISRSLFGISILSAMRIQALAEDDESDPDAADPRDLLQGEGCSFAIWDDDLWDLTRSDGGPLRCSPLFEASIHCVYEGDAHLPDEKAASEADAERMVQALKDRGWAKLRR